MSHKEWVPHAYQERAVEHLLDNPIAALFLDPGLGKTSITLEAFRQLKEAGVAKRMLVVAPLRVCQLVWRQEGAQWTQFRDLQFSLLHGTLKQKRAALDADADIYLINPEGIAWLADQVGGGLFGKRRFPFDTVVIDELTKFKNARSKRHKALRPLLAKVARRWGLTGTPVPNGYMDLFGQMLILDDGRALGTYITHFRNRYFQQGYTGFDWTLRAGAAKEIEERIAPYVLRMSAADYLDLPQLVNDVREIEMEPKIRKLYAQLKKESVLELGEDGTVVAENAGGVYSKLKQMANGAVYLIDDEGKKKHVWLHDYKLDALEELIEELQGKQLLVGYEFRHDLERLLARFPDAPYLGHGVSAKKAQEIERAWNAGEMPVLFAHPASAGHGLNFQKGGAGHLCWFSTTVDYELYEQFLKRILRQGNTADRVVNHALVVRGTVDALSLDTIHGKAVTQERFLQALNSELVGAPAADQGDEDMPVRKLRRKSEVEETEEAAPKKRGWGKRASEEEEDEDDEEEEAPKRRRRTVQREKVASRIAGDEDEEEADEDEDEAEEEAPKRGFSKSVRRRLKETEDEDDADEEAEDEPEEAPAPKRRRAAKAAKPEPVEEEADDSEEDEAPFDGEATFDGGQTANALGPVMGEGEYRRIRALELAGGFAEKIGVRSANDAIKAAKEFEKYLSGDK